MNRLNSLHTGCRFYCLRFEFFSAVKIDTKVVTPCSLVAEKHDASFGPENEDGLQLGNVDTRLPDFTAL